MMGIGPGEVVIMLLLYVVLAAVAVYVLYWVVRKGVKAGILDADRAREEQVVRARLSTGDLAPRGGDAGAGRGGAGAGRGDAGAGRRDPGVGGGDPGAGGGAPRGGPGSAA